MNEDSEVLDLVNPKDQVIGSVERSSAYAKATGDTYIRFISAFLMRPDGKIWTPTRALHKKIAPGGIDYGCAGHVLSGESYDDALRREMQEETGITGNLAFDLITKNRIIGNPNFFEAVYLLQITEQQPRLSEEHVSGSWLSTEEIRALLDTGTPAKGSLPNNLIHLQTYLDAHGTIN